MADVPPGGDDPLRMYLVVRRGGLTDLARGGELAGAAAVACVRLAADDERFAADLEAWRPRPGKVTLRARGGQWTQLLDAHAHVLAGEPDGAAVAALPPQRRSRRDALLDRLQAMTSALEPPPGTVARDPARVTYVVNPRLEMSSGKTLAQIAHAAVMAAGTGALEPWVAAGCPARVVRPAQRGAFDALCASDGLAARVVDAGLTEVAPGTVTVLALPPAATVSAVVVPGAAEERGQRGDGEDERHPAHDL
ncbi:MAG TPA: aminoacyl-tRNA hydrolase [Solirubrobacteraceae bacterium]|nr:aminoacyl-tRNA hydrolase [Solirubrobacteraceae bacterium]